MKIRADAHNLRQARESQLVRPIRDWFWFCIWLVDRLGDEEIFKPIKERSSKTKEISDYFRHQIDFFCVCLALLLDQDENLTS